jgi:hypothetical protein
MSIDRTRDGGRSSILLDPDEEVNFLVMGEKLIVVFYSCVGAGCVFVGG